MKKVCTIGDFNSYARKYDYVSFDIFDTLIFRRLLKVNEVHDTVSAYALTQIGKQQLRNPLDLTLLRYRITNILKGSTNGSNQEPVIAMVWDHILRRDVVEQSQRRTIVDRIVSFELEIERSNLSLVPGVLDLLVSLRTQDKKIIAISDMYFEVESIRSLLKSLKVLDFFDHVYVSATEKLTKQSGDLFKYVLRDLGIKASSIIHVGDNLRSDVEKASETGIAAVLVEQPQLLQIRRPDYGKRERIEEEVADVVKMHLFSLLLASQNRKVDHIYFMARDGCATGVFLRQWKSPLIQGFMPPPDCTELYLNRVLSCWGGIDFSGEWLRQAVDLAFWLHHGEATAEELCAMLGVATIPLALGNATLRANSDASHVVDVLSNSKLVGPIKASIISKRAAVLGYLQDIGFFSNQTVAFSDVGYSGTVLRDLNNLFLNRAVEENIVHPPAMLLSLIATSDNMPANRTKAYPFVEFAPHPILPAEKLPSELKASFAWLELFFKHPTLKPILRLVQKNGHIVPDLRHDEVPSNPVPSQRVASYAFSHDEDIVLLWMAALNFTGQIVDPIVNRFTNPDPDTIAQMSDEVFEQHSVQGTRRSIILKLPGARIEAISIAAQQGDYWIPGSIAASEGRTPVSTVQATVNPNIRRRRDSFRNWFKSSAVVRPRLPVTPSTSFDASFYRGFYNDLRHLTTTEDLWHHYVAHGRAENRLINQQALIAQLEAEFEYVPADFDGRYYIRINNDLADQINGPDQALNHYIRFGRHEGRKYLTYNSVLMQEFDTLRTSGSIVLNDDEYVEFERGKSTLSLFLRRYGVNIGAWLDDLDVAEFKAMHGQWCGPISGAASCVVSLMDRGLARCASLSLRAPFDAEYYRRQRADLEDLNTAELFIHYLNNASREGLYPSEQAALKSVWGRLDFPSCLDWEGYRARFARLANAPRSLVLAAFIDDPDPKRREFVDRDATASFFEFLAVRAWRTHGRTADARTLFQNALDAGAGVGHIQHLLGDMALQLGEYDQALMHFRLGLEAPDANLWSSFHAARLLLEKEDYRSALSVLSNSASSWQERAPWRRLWATAMQAKCDAILQELGTNIDYLDCFGEADAFMDEITAEVPVTRRMAHSPTGLSIVSSRLNLAPTRSLVSAPVSIVGQVGSDDSDQVESFLAHDTIIFHETQCSYSVLRSIALARSLGKQTVAWLGDLDIWRGYALNQWCAGEAGKDSLLRVDNLLSFTLIARYCDSVVTTLPGSVPLLRHVASGREVNVMCRPAGNHRGDNRRKRVVLMVLNAAVENEVKVMIQEAMVNASLEDPEIFFLVPQWIVRGGALRLIAGRWAIIDDKPDLVAFARLIETVDAVLHSPDEDSCIAYSTGTEAAYRGIPSAAVFVETPQDCSTTARGLRFLIPGSQYSELAGIVDIVRKLINCNSSMPTPSDNTQRRELHENHPIVIPARKRILFTNVFFVPQVIGGATRVLKDNIDYMLDWHSNEFDIAIFTADEQNDHVDEWRIDSYRGVPVYRVSTPQELNMDWREENPAVGARFRAILLSFKPDLVHIHCLQRLSATVAEVCIESEIPYIVTLHDAWWISDFPFLTDETGLPVVVMNDYYDQKRLRDVPVARSVLRAERLRRVLLQADRRLAVSESFAAIYRNAGIPCEALENGVSCIQQIPRAVPGVRVELCHIGGLQYHKGAYLIEAALRSNAYSNLRLTIIDLARTFGQQTQTMWGTTPVTITGKMSTAELAQFYSRMNVLLAPSTWPESYGLVSREALQHGLWVIASIEGGAMSDPVSADVNGFAVSIEDPNELAQALHTIDNNAHTYRYPPATKTPMKTANDQSRQLIEIYNVMIDGD